mmetsp:Transcript_5675/g.12590  ORF Transcript_5675/g.12590 Transcript_5675/m.12590 type:complete len:255 (-) Transcript_5675:491-1255(-)
MQHRLEDPRGALGRDPLHVPPLGGLHPLVSQHLLQHLLDRERLHRQHLALPQPEVPQNLPCARVCRLAGLVRQAVKLVERKHFEAPPLFCGPLWADEHREDGLDARARLLAQRRSDDQLEQHVVHLVEAAHPEPADVAHGPPVVRRPGQEGYKHHRCCQPINEARQPALPVLQTFLVEEHLSLLRPKRFPRSRALGPDPPAVARDGEVIRALEREPAGPLGYEASQPVALWSIGGVAVADERVHQLPAQREPST